MINNLTPSGKSVLEKLGISPNNLLCDFPIREQRLQYRAVVQWLTDYKPKLDATNLEKVKSYVEAFYHLCNVKDWTRASTIIFERSITPTGKELHQQLRTWSYPYEQIELCKKLLGKLELRLEGVLMCSLGIAYDDLGQYQTSIEYHQKHLEIGRQLGNKEFEASALTNLGNDYQSLGNYFQAIEYHQQALDIHYENRNLEKGCSVCGNLGNAYFAIGELQIAFKYYEQYLEIAQLIDNRESESGALASLGNYYRVMGQCQTAIEYLQKALVIHREFGDQLQEAGALGNIGVAYKNLGQYETAISYHKKALAIAQKINNRQGEATTLGNLGNCYKNMGQYKTAIDYHNKALAICREIGDRDGEARAFQNMGNAYGSMGHIDRAWLCWMKSLWIYDSLQIHYAVKKALDEYFKPLTEIFSTLPRPPVNEDVWQATLVSMIDEFIRSQFEKQLSNITSEFGTQAADRIVQLIATAGNK